MSESAYLLGRWDPHHESSLETLSILKPVFIVQYDNTIEDEVTSKGQLTAEGSSFHCDEAPPS